MGPSDTVISVLLAGGGTAGHVSPLLATADALARRLPGVQVAALGTERGLEARLVPARGLPLHLVPRVPMPRRPDAAALRFPVALADAVRAADRAVVGSGAQVVVGFGGYVASPAYLAARRRGIPVVVHEGNARPGFANRLGARLTRHVATTFPSTRLPHARCLGMPLRREITTLDRAARRAEGRAYFDLEAEATTLLVTGGSLGAQRLNETIAAAAPALAAAGVQVLHVAGGGKQVTPARGPAGLAAGPTYRVVEYVERMELAYAAADLVVCRAGANTVCELTAVGLPAAYVPLPIGNGEQRLNAADVVAAGGGLLVEDAECTPAWVDGVLLPLLRDPARLAAMATAAAGVGRRDADEALVDLIIQAVRRSGPQEPQ